MEEKKFISVPEAAKILGCHESTIRKWIKDGLVPVLAKGPGKQWISKEWIEKKSTGELENV